jgi:hypothetical protein
LIDGQNARQGRQTEAACNIDHLSCVFTLLNVVLRVVPTALTAAMIAMEMPEASKQYSIAVAPELSLKKRAIADIEYSSKVPKISNLGSRP